jgi:hypothetical protein
MVVVGVIHEVSLGEEAALSFAGGVGPGHAGQNAGAFAFQHLLAVHIAAIGQDGDFGRADGRLRLPAHRRELCPIIALVHHFGLVTDLCRSPTRHAQSGQHGISLPFPMNDLFET